MREERREKHTGGRGLLGDLRGKNRKRKKESRARQIGIPRKGDQRIFLTELKEQNLWRVDFCSTQTEPSNCQLKRETY